jgi:hypothetical protein
MCEQIDRLLVYGRLEVNATSASIAQVSVGGLATIATLNVTNSATISAPLLVAAPAQFTFPVTVAAALSATTVQTYDRCRCSDSVCLTWSC